MNRQLRRRRKSDQQAGRPAQRDERRDAAETREHDAFDQQLLHDPPAAGAHRQPNRNLALARRCAREQQAREVGAGDQQHHGRHRHQDQQHRPQHGDAAVRGVVEREHGGAMIDVAALARPGRRASARSSSRARRAPARATIPARAGRSGSSSGCRARSSRSPPGITIGCVPIGSHMSYDRPDTPPKKPGAATPTTVKGCELILSWRPITLGIAD